MDRIKSVESVLKKYGEGSVFRLGSNAVSFVSVIPTGSLSLDLALGVGGFPRGRIIEIYGPEQSGKTTLCLSAAANCQSLGGMVAIVDSEHALDIDWARRCGVDAENLYISQPQTGEQALDIVERFLSDFDLIIVDSVAALVPQAEIDGEMGDKHIGLQARLMSQAMRKLIGPVKNSGACVVFTNQIRQKIGVLFGCVHGETLVNFVDGRSIPIKRVVEEKIEGKVWSWNGTDFVPNNIVGWHFNGNTETNDDWLHIETTSVDGRGRFGLTVTPDHKVLTDCGWVCAKDLIVGKHRLITKYNRIVNGTLEQFLSGTLVGDSHLSIRRKNTALLRIQNNRNREYLEWKKEKLSKFFKFHYRPFNRGFYKTNYYFEFAKIKKELGRRNPLFFLRRFSWLGMALWIMDDGNFDDCDGHCRYNISIRRFVNTPVLDEIVDHFSKLGIPCTLYRKRGYIRFNAESANEIAKNIAKFVPPCMQYKLPVKYRGHYVDFSLNNTPCVEQVPVDIVLIRKASPRQMKMKGKYDLTIENSSSYMVGGKNNGVIIHNSPETTTGGLALRFYASVRVDIRKRDSLKDGEEVSGNSVHAKIVKNRVAPPFRTADFEIHYDEGISKTAELISIGVTLGYINKSGSWYTLTVGEKEIKCQGDAALRRLLLDEKEVSLSLENKIRSHFGLPLKEF